MAVLGGPFVGAALLLSLGGAFELWRPAATVGALRAIGAPASALAVRLGGLVAAAVSVGAVVRVDRSFALAVFGFYILLTTFVLVALLRHAPLQSCGCFGREDTSPTVGHLVLNAVAAVVAGFVALAPGNRGWASVHLDTNILVVSLFVVLTAAAALFAYLALTLVPRLATDDHRREPRST